MTRRVRRKGNKSIRVCVLEYFEANPDEELTTRDIAAKFDCTLRSAENALNTCKGYGEVQRVVAWRRGSGVPL